MCSSDLGITLKQVTPSGFFGSEIVLETDSAKVKPGLAGNLIVNAYAAPGGGAKNKNKGKANQRRAPLGSLPAIPFEIVER